MFNYHDSIEEIEKKIKKYSERRNKVENANYILAMQLKAIKNGELKTVEDIAKWDFEKIKMGDLVLSIEGKEGVLSDEGKKMSDKIV